MNQPMKKKSKKNEVISNYEAYKKIRKPMPKPTISMKDKTSYKRNKAKEVPDNQ
jgi:hypothetical protein